MVLFQRGFDFGLSLVWYIKDGWFEFNNVGYLLFRLVQGSLLVYVFLLPFACKTPLFKGDERRT